jgi:hypothetical protein
MRRACRAALVTVVVTMMALAWAAPAGTTPAPAGPPAAAICQPQRDGPLAPAELGHACFFSSGEV